MQTMPKFIIIVAAPAFLFATPAFAQSAPASVGTTVPAPATINLGSPGKVDAARQTRRHPAFNGPHGSASDLTDRPPSDPTAARHPAFNGPHGSASDLTDRPPSDPTAARGHVKVFDGATGGPLRNAPAATRRPGFDGPHGSATNLRDTPSSDPTAGHIATPTLYGRKAGDDQRQDAKPAPRPTGGLTKVGAGTLQTTGAARMQSQNNLKQMGTANAPR
jgi:hypothetical protein